MIWSVKALAKKSRFGRFEGTGPLTQEHGVWVFRTGQPMAASTTDEMLRRVYDAMLAHCALKAEAETIYSWNARHYAQCGADVTRRVRTP